MKSMAVLHHWVMCKELASTILPTVDSAQFWLFMSKVLDVLSFSTCLA